MPDLKVAVLGPGPWGLCMVGKDAKSRCKCSSQSWRECLTVRLHRPLKDLPPRVRSELEDGVATKRLAQAHQFVEGTTCVSLGCTSEGKVASPA